MRVLHLTDDLSGISGVRSYLEGLAAAMEPLGIRCELETLGGPGGLDTALSRWISPKHYRALSRRLRDDPEPPAVVHAHNLWMRLSPSPLLAARRRGIPVVMTVHDYHLVCPRKWMITSRDEPCATGFGPRCLIAGCRGARQGLAWLPYNDLRWTKVWLHRRLLSRWVDRFVCPSRHLAEWMERSLGPAGVLTVPNFTPPPAPATAPEPAGPPTVLYAGRLAREKGVDVLVEAVARVQQDEPETALVVAGDGPRRAGLEELARHTLRPGSFRFTGRLAPEELAPLYRRAAVVALPTLWMENCPVAVLEAMAHGRPVVATRIGGLPELVEDGVTGYLFERGDAADLAGKLVRLLADPELRRRAGEAAAGRYRQRYAPEVHARRLAGIYRSLLEGRTP